MVAKAFLASQASSAASERLFGDLGSLEGRKAQSQLTSTLEMRELVRIYVQNELSIIQKPQNGLLHPEAEAFKRLCSVVAHEVANE